MLHWRLLETDFRGTQKEAEEFVVEFIKENLEELGSPAHFMMGGKAVGHNIEVSVRFVRDDTLDYDPEEDPGA